MKLSKSFKHALNMVLHSKLRSWLTIIGIIIGVASVIAIVSIGEGLEQSVNDQMGDLGSDIITITPGYSQGQTIGRMRPGSNNGGSSSATEEEVVLDRTDLQALKSISNIDVIDTNIKSSVDVSFMGKSGSVSLTGVDQKVWSQITTKEISEGRLLTSSDQNVIVVGGKLASDYFGQEIGINKMITIEGSSYRVVGILDDTSTNIYMPISMAYQILDEKEVDVYDSIIIKVKNEDEVDLVVSKIETKLMQSRHVNEKTRDFTVSSNQALLETRNEMLGSMTLFLTAIAAVSLVVGAVGIANTMFTSVVEKTKEIGIMKAIGARNGDIMMIFLFNAALIGLVGGIIGVLVGIFASGGMSALLTGMPMGRNGGGTIVTIESVLTALAVSIAAGIIAGIVPAYQASKLKPVDALRYE